MYTVLEFDPLNQWLMFRSKWRKFYPDAIVSISEVRHVWSINRHKCYNRNVDLPIAIHGINDY